MTRTPQRPNASQGAVLDRMLHEVRSGVVAMGAVLGLVKHRIAQDDPSEREAIRREIELLIRTTARIDSMLLSSRALLRPKRTAAARMPLVSLLDHAVGAARREGEARAITVTPSRVPHGPPLVTDGELAWAALREAALAAVRLVPCGGSVEISVASRPREVVTRMRTAAPEGGGGEAPATPAGAGFEIAGALARRLGGRLHWSVDRDGDVTAEIVLPRGRAPRGRS